MFSITSGKQDRKRRGEVLATISTEVLSQQGLRDPPPSRFLHFPVDYSVISGKCDIAGTEREGEKKERQRKQLFQNSK